MQRSDRAETRGGFQQAKKSDLDSPAVEFEAIAQHDGKLRSSNTA